VTGGAAGVPAMIGSAVAIFPVRLSVYDMLGREVAVLVNEDLQPGSSAAQWESAGHASGTYVARLQGGSFVQTAVQTGLFQRSK